MCVYDGNWKSRVSFQRNSNELKSRAPRRFLLTHEDFSEPCGALHNSIGALASWLGICACVHSLTLHLMSEGKNITFVYVVFVAVVVYDRIE